MVEMQVQNIQYFSPQIMASKDAMLKGAKSKFWRHFENILQAHQEQFPLLSYLARVVLAVPAASSKSERVFSVAGNMVTPKRNRLAPQQV